jgi:hypothetical protein
VDGDESAPSHSKIAVAGGALGLSIVFAAWPIPPVVANDTAASAAPATNVSRIDNVVICFITERESAACSALVNLIVEFASF